MADRDDLLRKIQKLFALAGNNPSEAEAHAAMLKAQALLFENGLSLQEVEKFDDPNAQKDERKQRDSDLRTGVMRLWHITLGQTVADNFRCFLLLGYAGSGKRCIRFIGMSRDVDAAVMTYNFLVRAAMQLWKVYLREWKRGNGGAPEYYDLGEKLAYTNKVKRDYMAGFVQGVTDQFREQVQTKALVLRKEKELVDWYEAQKWRTDRTARAGGNSHNSHGERGYRDGRGARAHSSITGR